MPFLATFCSSLLWTVSTQIFSHQGRRISVFRLNFYKACLAFLFFSLTLIFFIRDYTAFHILFSEKPKVLLFLCVSGLSGFAIGDLFTFRAFAIMGAARGLMIQCFAPIFVAAYSYILLGTTLSPRKLVGLGFLTLCVFCLSFDKKQKLPFSWHAVLLCFTGMLFDSFGVVLSKMSFTAIPELTSVHANVIRIGVSVPVLFLINAARKKHFGISDLPKQQRSLIILGSFFGTYLALMCYLYAISHVEAAVITGLASITPLYASAYEHVRDKIFPSLAFFIALSCMFCGVYLLM